MKLLLLAALLNFEASGFDVRMTLPENWSYSAEQGFVAPAELAASCRVRGTFYTDREWDRFLVSALRSSDRYKTAHDARTLHKINGHRALTNRYMRDGETVRDIYIDLGKLEPDSGAVFTFEGTNAGDCEMEFVSMIHSARITRRRPS